MQTKRYGWHPDLPDFRDFRLARAAAPIATPDVTDHRPKMPVVYDQGDLGSCTGNSSAAAFEYDLIRQGLPSWTPSRLGIYYDERVLEGTVKTDAGAQIRDAVKVLATNGAAPETLWPYIPANFAVAPPANYVKTAAQDLALQYARVDQSQNGIEECLFKGYPVIFGFTVYTSFESEAVAQTGIMPMPSSNERCLGGHAVLCVGYERSKRMFIIRNSWGAGWGDKGYFYMPYDYMLNANLADDLWALYTVEEAGKQQ
jgi:C1A family cysteine protease